ncbi:MAG: MarR family transcriptional regulator [Halobacteriaceae archaeon]
MVAFASDNASESTPSQRAERLADLPPSAKLVFKVLEDESPLTQSQIAERSRLSKRTTRHALSKLTEAGVVEEQVYIPDARRRLYSPLPVEEAESVSA